jgi:hypothetical protein
MPLSTSDRDLIKTGLSGIFLALVWHLILTLWLIGMRFNQNEKQIRELQRNVEYIRFLEYVQIDHLQRQVKEAAQR